MRDEIERPEQGAVDPSTTTTTTELRRRSVLTFVVLVFVLSAPLLIVSAVIGAELAPGLPVAALQAFCPGIAAAILTYREAGSGGVAALLKRAFDYKRIENKIWYIPILALTPAVMVLSYVVMRVLGLPLPTPQLSVVTALALFAAFLIPSIAEEVGWSGFATNRLQTRWTALETGVVLGLVWATWHVVALVQAHRSATWIAFWAIGTVGYRVLIVWRYNNTNRSVFAAVLCHTVDNVSWLMFPNFGSHYDPRVTGLIVAGVAGVVTVVWGPRTLTRKDARYRQTR